MTCSTLFEGNDLKWTIHACYSLEMESNFGLNGNMEDWKEIQEKEREINSMKAYIAIDKNFC